MYYIDDFEKNLLEKGSSKATVSAYLADLDDFEEYIKKSNIKLEKVNSELIQAYVDWLVESGKSNATKNRRVASLKKFYDYLILREAIKKNPCTGIKASKIKEKELVYLSYDEIEKLLELPEKDASGLRDKALLEFMYATGLRVSEVCDVNITDLNMSIGFVSVHSDDRSKTRMVPMGKYCRKALLEYINTARPVFVGSKKDTGALFLSFLGERITRQGIWKILKNYSEKVPFGDKITPQSIRSSFAVHLLQNGADVNSLQEILGLEDLMATKIYLSVIKNRIIDVYDKAFPRA